MKTLSQYNYSIQYNKLSMKKTINFLVSVTIILVPILYQYASPLSFLSMGDFLILIFSSLAMFYDFILHKKINYIPKLGLIVGILLLQNMFSSVINVSYYSWSSAITMILKMVMYLIVVNVSYNHFDLKMVYKLYKYICYIFCIYLFIQFLYYKLKGGYLPICVNYNWLFLWEKRTSNLSYYYHGIYYKYRPSSLFLEPGYYVFYEMPFLYLLLIKEKNILMSIIITISFVISTSGAGVLLSLAGWTIFFIYNSVKFKKNRIYTKKIVLLFIVVFLSFIIYVIISNYNYMKYFNSFNTRFLRGFVVFSKFTLGMKIFGAGINNVENYMNVYSIKTLFDETNLNFGSTFTKSFMEFGVIGIIILLFSVIYYYHKLIKGKSKIIFSFFVLFFLYMFFEDMLFIFRMVYIMSFLMYFIKQFDENIS